MSLALSHGIARPITGEQTRQFDTVQSSTGQSLQQEALIVRPAVKTFIEANPGTIVAATFKVINLTSEQQTYKGEIILPKGWKPITREFPFELKAGEADVRLASFSIPSDVPVDTYRIRYLVRDRAATIHEAAAIIDVAILSVIQLDLKLLNAPRFVVAGTIFPTVILVTNQGNSVGSVRLSGNSSYNYPVRLDSTIIHLAPKESRQLRIFVTTDEKADKLNHTLQIEAKSLQDTTIRAKISSVVEIIPRESKVGNEFLEFPVLLRLREVGQDRKFAPQAEIYGYGSLDEKKTDRLEFLFRGGETQTISTLGERDEYRLSYSRKNFEINVGDQNYSLSTLTEAGRYATGIGGKGRIGRVEAGGFYNETRWSSLDQKETGGFVSYDAIDGLSTLRLNYLSKREQFSSDMVSFQGLFTPFTGSRIDLEYGTGVKDGKHDHAYAAHVVGSQRWINYDLRYVKAGPNYGGYFRDINFVSSSINLQPLRNIRLEGYFRQETRNLARDSNQVFAPFDKSYQIGVGYSNYVSIYYRQTTQEDQFDSSKYRSRENAIQARVGYNFSAASIFVTYDYGIRRDELLHIESPAKSLALTTSFNPTARQNYSTTFEISKFKDIYSGEDQERLSASLNAWILFGQSTQAKLNLYGSRTNALFVQTYSMFEASLEHIFPFNHKVTLHGRYNVITPAFTNNQAAYVLEYQIPIGVPFRRISGIGQLRGSIVDEQGKGIAGVLISAGGSSTLSDKNGNFYFASLKPGSIFLFAEMASIGFNRITKQPMPMEVSIRGGEETTIVLSVTRSATVAGSITLYSTNEHEFGDSLTALVEVGGKSGVFLEISNGTEIHRRVSDNRGRFLFADLRPGTWILKVTGGDIPENSMIDPEEIKIELAAGEKTEVKFQLKPRRRTIKMLQPGKLIEVAPPIVEKKVVIPPSPTLKPEKRCIVISNKDKTGYVLQISSWVRKSKVSQTAKLMKNVPGLQTYVMTARIPTIGIRYRIFIGVFNTREDAVDFCHHFNFDEN